MYILGAVWDFKEKQRARYEVILFPAVAGLRQNKTYTAPHQLISTSHSVPPVLMIATSSVCSRKCGVILKLICSYCSLYQNLTNNHPIFL